MTDSQQLLAEYVTKASEPAFRELVVRYVDLVFSAALRLVDGDAHRAQDVSQVVFVDLARLAGRLQSGTLLGGWLHRHTCYVARTMMRGERRRDARERQAAEMNALHQLPDQAFQEIAPVLDEVIDELPADDREAILLRYFERRNLRSVGDALGINENVAQKRVARAVEELSLLLRRRGFTVPTAVLAGGLAANATQAAPLGLAIHLTKVVLGHGIHASATATAAKTAGAAKLKLALVAALILAGVIIPLRLHLQSSIAPGQTDPFPSSIANEPATARPPEMFPVNPPGQNASANSTAPADVGSSAGESSTVEDASANHSQVTIQANSTPSDIQGAIAPVPKVRLFAKPGSMMRISGTANTVHTHWQAESPIIGGTLDVESGFLRGSEHSDRRRPIAAEATAFVAIRSLKSVDAEGKPYSDAMDDSMHSLLVGWRGSAPHIVFHLVELRLDQSGKSRTNSDHLTARGQLAIAGVTNSVTIPLEFLRLGTNIVEIHGSNQLLMSSFEIHPHLANFGIPNFEVKIGDLVTVQFKWHLQERNEAADKNRNDLAVPDGESVTGASEKPSKTSAKTTGNPSPSRWSRSRPLRN